MWQCIQSWPVVFVFRRVFSCFWVWRVHPEHCVRTSDASTVSEYNEQEDSEYSGTRVGTAEYVSSRALVGMCINTSSASRMESLPEMTRDDPR